MIPIVDRLNHIPSRHVHRVMLGAVAGVLLTVGVESEEGCTPKREAAIADITQKDVTCMTGKAADPNMTPAKALEMCGISTALSSVQDLIDIFTGAQFRYCAGDAGAKCSTSAHAADGR